MKMKPEHYNYLKAAIKPILARNVTPETERGRWSALHSAVPVSWICSDLYPIWTTVTSIPRYARSLRS
jgi:hypothetical protein